MITWLKKLFLCWMLRDHEWTCAAQQGIPATPEQLAAGIKGFLEYAAMYCKRCGHISELSKKHG